MWALARNPMWVNDDSVAGGGGDCTNFVSQALYEGGWIMVYPSWNSLNPWWAEKLNYDRHQRSRSWGSAEQFKNFLKYSGRARPCLLTELMFGDVIQQGLSGRDHVSHTMIITRTAQGKIFLSYHSTDHLNISLQDLIKRVAPGSWFNYWKILDYYQDK
jgi:hypothetical protein